MLSKLPMTVLHVYRPLSFTMLPFLLKQVDIKPRKILDSYVIRGVLYFHTLCEENCVEIIHF